MVIELLKKDFYEVGCKRLVVSNTFYAAIQKPTAKLVTDPIKGIETKGVRSADGKLHNLDVLVTATGFDAHRYFRSMEIKGIAGLTLEDTWRNNPRTYCAQPSLTADAGIVEQHVDSAMRLLIRVGCGLAANYLSVRDCSRFVSTAET